MIVLFSYNSYFKTLPILNNNFYNGLNDMYYREKSYIIKRYTIDSYILWLYLNHLYTNFLQEYQYLNISTKLIITPVVSSALTLVKSPMAQKTWSKEQVGFKYFNINLYLYIKNFYLLEYIHKNDITMIYFILKYIKKLTFLTHSPILILHYSVIMLGFNYKNTLLI